MGMRTKRVAPAVRILPWLAAAGLWLTAGPCFGQTPFTETSLVRQHCGACHKPDESGRLEVIEETRKSPEEWKNVIIRMTRLNSAVLDDAKFHPVVKELSAHLGLTPAEMAGVAYYNSDENSQYREVPGSDMEKRIFTACVRCHTYGKIASHRMTESQWNENRNLHLGYYPTSVPQMREMDWTKESKDLIPELARLFPFDAPEWKAWMDGRKPVDLGGRWRVAGYQPGLGVYEGWYEFAPDAEKGADEYRVSREVRYASGVVLKQRGTGTLFSGYHLRYALAPTPLTGRVEGVFDQDAATMRFQGKWWAVVQDANAFGNEQFIPAGEKPGVLAAFPQSFKADPALEQTLTLVGAGFPEGLAPADIVFSDPEVSVKSVSESGPDKIVCKITVGGASLRTATLKVKDAAYADPVILYDRMDGIRILPHIGRARVSSGEAYPPQGVQFVARGVHFGADGKPDTGDDVMLDPVDVDWKLDEEKTREGDDDLKYLATGIDGGLYTPVTTYGPIAERKQHHEGVGLIAVEASLAAGDAVLKDRALLGVTVPDFVTHIK
ncbi:quinohemoprotein amine dehydrogenase subunit alpha [Desulfococcus sp.]|uniref:quinohemoprotein amine dehydrogenase subunit alpha n=1 Tax=Desulfococcus sp. TaxID=2025834 RepID=UPI00359446FE